MNAESVPASKMREIASILIDIHGQHEHQSLLHKQKHLEILDEYSWRETGSLKKKCGRELPEISGIKGKA